VYLLVVFLLSVGFLLSLFSELKNIKSLISPWRGWDVLRSLTKQLPDAITYFDFPENKCQINKRNEEL
jgi:hypothetical protein